MTIHPIQSRLIVHQEQPLNAEPPGDLLRQSFLTPQQHFYVRTHGSIPAVDPASYRLLITGMVQRKRELSLDELRSMSPVHTVTATLECAGNRRDELMAVKPIPGEVPWRADVIGTAKWHGVPLREVLQAVGVEADARYVAFTSLDEAQFEGEKVHFGSSIALEKAFPPEVTAQTADWSRGKTIEDLTLNAVITTPQEGETVAAGPTRIQGYAITGAGAPVERVELSIDGGKTWTTANLVERADPYAWCFWEVTVTLSPGDCQMIVRAWDASRQTQPEDVRQLWNFKGYMNNAWHKVKIHVA